jgi:hypothetical protein
VGHKSYTVNKKFEQNAANPKKTWETLNEILGKARKSEKI